MNKENHNKPDSNNQKNPGSNNQNRSDSSRRKFLSDVTIGAIGAIGAAGILQSCSSSGSIASLSANAEPQLHHRAPDGKVLKAGLIGCGRRGTGAAVNFLNAGPHLQITALGDVFPSQVERCRSLLKQSKNVDIPDENCFTGFDSYEKVIDSGVDIVLLTAPGHFRPAHVEAAVNAGKHIFQEKPVCVDPVGARKMAEMTDKAKGKKLCMVSGTIRRYQQDYIHTRQMVANGAIGDITSATIIRNGNALWWVDRQPGWTDMEYMLWNWGNFTWLSGDTILEKFVHEIDVMSWYVRENPVRAIGYGGRQQRASGDQYDFFSIIYEYENGMRTHCAHREISGCDNGKTELFTGTRGSASADGKIFDKKGKLVWEYPPDREVPNPFQQEFIELITAIRTGKYINDSDEQIRSNRIALMGRMSAYTGKNVSWEEVLNSDLRLGPDVYDLNYVPNFPEQPPVIGRPTPPSTRFL